jgi:hypothetical protein
MLHAVAEIAEGVWQGHKLVLIKGPSLDPFDAMCDQDAKHYAPSGTAAVWIICTTEKKTGM